MISLAQLALFSVASLALIFTPGPDIIYVMTRGMAQGRGSALAAAAGFAVGNFVHTFFAIVGLSALLMSSATAFQLVKYAGALYLIYLGIRMIRSSAELSADDKVPPLRYGIIFRQSILANVLNPKVALFFLAFFPQFVDPSRGNVSAQMLILGTLFVLLTMIGFGIVGLFSGLMGSWLRTKPAVGDRVGRGAGGILVLLGLRLAWPESR